eukprot:199448-Prorocentrum_minimum.AAC.1
MFTSVYIWFIPGAGGVEHRGGDRLQRAGGGAGEDHSPAGGGAHGGVLRADREAGGRGHPWRRAHCLRAQGAGGLPRGAGRAKPGGERHRVREGGAGAGGGDGGVPRARPAVRAPAGERAAPGVRAGGHAVGGAPGGGRLR